MEYLFVYGKLKTTQGGIVSAFLQNNAKLLGNGYMHGLLYNLGSYPGVIATNNCNNKVWGEIFEIENTKKVFDVIDDFEEAWPLVTNDPEYSRKMIDVYYKNITLPCWVYVYNWAVDDDKLIVGGEY